ncbi:MAG TPA: three-Cys-motif partner protein TcmP [Pseudolabrys sp.]|nr:three-Cys-motif partner protein TcmP [Pseudolabrys sp.]
MTDPFRFDEVGEWSVLKLDIIERYGGAYTKAFNKTGRRLKKYYIDGFSGGGAHRVKGTGQQIEGSPPRALKISPPFDGFYFIDLNPKKTSHLEKLCEGRSDVQVITGDANEYLRTLLPTIQYKKYNRALCVLDPYGLHLDWEVMALAGQSGAVDMFLNFPVMDMNRNAFWRNPEKVPQDGIERMNRFWGDGSWKQAAYAKSKQPSFLFETEDEKQPNTAIVAAFQQRLKNVAGFKYVPAPLPMLNSRNAAVYYLFFASAKPVAEDIITSIFKKYGR